MVACAKHFPGDGVDDLDQHVVTSVNSLSLEKWWAVFGQTFGKNIEAGVLSIMIGHIAFPAWDNHLDQRRIQRPATVSRRIVTDLLRKRLGFEDLIITDDMSMGGIAGYMNRKDRTVGCLNAGCDMLLFPRLPEDYTILCEAYSSGTLSGDRITDATRRVLELKTRLGLHKQGRASRV
ncbi:MAG: hypothetical protein GKR87_06495 [Kiritimatiellae bacterium]|nr:hypothetical protein [Kiritimatiellia bacterium]